MGLFRANETKWWKKIVITCNTNEYNMVKNPHRQEADQLAIHMYMNKRRRGVELQ